MAKGGERKGAEGFCRGSEEGEGAEKVEGVAHDEPIAKNPQAEAVKPRK